MSQLKKQMAPDCQVSADLSTICTEPTSILWAERILDRRMIRRGAQMVKQMLIKWLALPEDMATWEDASDYAGSLEASTA